MVEYEGDTHFLLFISVCIANLCCNKVKHV